MTNNLHEYFENFKSRFFCYAHNYYLNIYNSSRDRKFVEVDIVKKIERRKNYLFKAGIGYKERERKNKGTGFIQNLTWCDTMNFVDKEYKYGKTFDEICKNLNTNFASRRIIKIYGAVKAYEDLINKFNNKGIEFAESKTHSGIGDTKKETLFDIWLPAINEKNKGAYRTYITFIRQEYPEIAKPFVQEIGEKLFWSKNVRGWQQYMAGFIFCCIKKHWITDQYTSTEWVKLLNKSFNANPNVKSYKNILANPPAYKYIKPFDNLPENK